MNKPRFLLKILNNSIKTTFRFLSNVNLEAHRAAVMGKGLPKVKPINNVKNIILISSGKGGVGKSTTSVNIATALKLIQPDKNVGLLDADVFGPSIPLMMNLKETPLLTKDNKMQPLINYGVKCMSMGFLIEREAPVIWRGLMVMQALEKLMRQVEWGETDYLIIDTPPGTGDTHLSLVQNLPINGVILVTTPQTASLQVTKRGGNMFKKLKTPLIGIIENMATITCPKCNFDIRAFGAGTEKLAKDLDCRILESLPLQEKISLGSDKGIPIAIQDSESKESKQFQNIALQIAQFLLHKDINKPL